MFPQHKLAAALCLVTRLFDRIRARGHTHAHGPGTGHLLDVKTGKLLDAQTIVVTGDTISSVAAHFLGYRPTGRQSD